MRMKAGGDFRTGEIFPKAPFVFQSERGFGELE